MTLTIEIVNDATRLVSLMRPDWVADAYLVDLPCRLIRLSA